MPILNYSTSVSATRTANELVSSLSTKGAKRVSVDYDTNGDPVAVEFVITLYDKPISFRLPCNVEGVFDAIRKQGTKIPRQYRNRQQAQRVAWRIVKDWVEAQLAIVEANQAQMAEVFMPYMIDAEGQTMFARFQDAQLKQLPAAPDNVVEGKFAINE